MVRSVVSISSSSLFSFSLLDTRSSESRDANYQRSYRSRIRLVEADSPFASFGVEKPLKTSLIIHVNFCDVCHHVWKAPKEATECINCKGNGPCARSLVSYQTEVRIT